MRPLRWRCWWFRMLSTNRGAFTGSAVVTPVLALGAGRIDADGALLGYFPSPGAFDSCIHLEARAAEATIFIGRGAAINNGCTLISQGPGIHIGEDVLLGPEVLVVDSDFHHLDADRRRSGPPAMAQVVIGASVFIGARSTVLKGVHIGQNTVVAAGSVVVHDLPANVVAAGNPCRVVSQN